MSDTKELLRQLQEKPIVRTVSLDRADVSEDDRSVALAFASSVPCDHYFGELKLDMKGMRTDRLDAGCALLVDHNWSDQVGIVDSYSTDKTTARAVVRFSQSVRGQEIYQDVLDGIRKSVSVGFMVHELELESDKDGMRTYVSNDWEPYEISLVSVPADISVGVGRSKELTKPAEESVEPQPTEIRNMENKETPAGTPAVEQTVAQRHAELAEFAAVYGQRKAAEDLLLTNPNASLDDIRELVRQRREPQDIETPKPSAEEAARNQRGAIVTPRYRGQLKSFRGKEAARDAYISGQWIRAVLLKDERSLQWCRDNGVRLDRANHTGKDNAYGGFLVPEEFENVMIDLRIEYGVARRNLTVVPMASDKKVRPRRTSGLTAYPIGAGTAITESRKGWDRVSLVAKDWGVLAKYENDLSDDAVINLADDLASEIAYAFSYNEDACAFEGDGSSTYHGITGIRTKLAAATAGLKTATGNAYEEVTLADLHGLVGLLPQYARRSGGVKWYCSHAVFANVLQRLQMSVGGVTYTETVNGPQPVCFGLPIEIVEVMPTTAANDQIALLYGNLSQAGMFGDRSGISIAMSDSDGDDFAENVMAIRGIERYDINIHSVGDTSNAGPVVGLKLASS